MIDDWSKKQHVAHFARSRSNPILWSSKTGSVTTPFLHPNERERTGLLYPMEAHNIVANYP